MKSNAIQGKEEMVSNDKISVIWSLPSLLIIKIIIIILTICTMIFYLEIKMGREGKRCFQ